MSRLGSPPAGMTDPHRGTRLAEELIHALKNPQCRETALSELSKNRDHLPDLACLLWNSFGTVAIIIEEIVSAYPHISPASLTAQHSNRVCNALALLQCMANHDGTRAIVVQLEMVHYLFPFLATSHQSSERPFEYLRLTSLGVIGALVKPEEAYVIAYLLKSEQVVPLCLRIMESGSELSRTVATFVVQKILQNDAGLNYICNTYQRFEQVINVLSSVVQYLKVQASSRLLKHVVRCYVLLTENHKARQALAFYLPQELKDDSMLGQARHDKKTLLGLLHLRQLAEKSDRSWNLMIRPPAMPPTPFRTLAGSATSAHA